MRVVSSAILAAIILHLAPAAGAEPFPRPASLEPQVRFWRNTFGVYSRSQAVVHDTADLDKIYSVVDVSANAGGLSPGELDDYMRYVSEIEVTRVRGILRRLHQAGANPKDLSAEEQGIFDLFKGDRSPDKFLDAVERVRSQRGLREKFAYGIQVAHGYFPEMERIFREEGLPTELTRLPLVESCFNVEAYSKVGAAGIWQFMPATGRIYSMNVGALVDERRDPIASTRSAARFLRHNYEQLDDAWPLAITAYNHGPGGIRRAIEETGTTDIGVIVERYHGPAFGFASRNFYAEFVAALDVENHHEAYFGTLDPEHREPSRVISLDRPVGIEVAARLAHTERETLVALNPALMDPVIDGRRNIPGGYDLRVPVSGASGFEERLAEFGAEQRVVRVSAPAVPSRRSASSKGGMATAHRVGKGDTLSEIAQRYKVSVASLKTANGLKGSQPIRRGQVLKIPGRT